MKKTNAIIIVSLFLLAGCSMLGGDTPPSKNESLNAVSPSGNETKDKKGFLQQKYDAWEKEDWEPNTQSQATETAPKASPVEKEPTQVPEAVGAPGKEPADDKQTAATGAAKDSNDSKTFTLQHYVDKWGHYLDEKAKDKNGSEPSNVEKLDAMPGIGTKK